MLFGRLLLSFLRRTWHPCEITCAQETVPPGAPYRSPSLSPEKRAANLVSRMTFEEQAAMLSGSGWSESSPIPRLGIPAIKMADGPMGVRSWVYSPTAAGGKNSTPVIEATAFPSGIDMAAAWDIDFVQHWGQALAQEVKAVCRDMILGPTDPPMRVSNLGGARDGHRRLGSRISPQPLRRHHLSTANSPKRPRPHQAAETFSESHGRNSCLGCGRG
jgi:hypothetical protein